MNNDTTSKANIVNEMPKIRIYYCVHQQTTFRRHSVIKTEQTLLAENLNSSFGILQMKHHAIYKKKTDKYRVRSLFDLSALSKYLLKVFYLSQNILQYFGQCI